MRTRHLLAFVAAVAVCGLTTSCDEAHSPETPLTPTPPTLITRLELSGPGTFAPGQTPVFTLVAFVNDGTQQDVTATAQWTSNNASVVGTLGQGRYRANAMGDTQINARYGAFNASREVIVVPTGTFRVIGRVVESPEESFWVPGAHVQVRDSSGNGPAADADALGYFRLYGVKPDTEFVVSRTGYLDSVRHVTIDNHSTVNVAISLAGPRAQIVGAYTVTLDLTGCRDGFRQDYAHRVYTAVVQQSGANVEVRFTEPAFAVNSANRGNLMQGRVDPTGLYLTADAGGYYYYGPGDFPFLVEVLPDGSRLVVSGTAALAASGAIYTGPLTGFAGNFGPKYPFDNYLGGCNRGQLTFAPR